MQSSRLTACDVSVCSGIPVNTMNRYHSPALRIAVLTRIAALGLMLAVPGRAECQAPTAPESQPPAAQPPTAQALQNDQLSVSGRYTRFERMLSQMADVLGREDPERADLLRRAISKGREQKIGDRIENIVRLMESKELGTAVEEQQGVADGLLVLLKLLQSEDRRSSVEKERERLNNLLKDIRNLANEERSARAAAQNATAPSSAAPPQQKALDNAGKILDDVEKSDRDREAESGESGETGEPSKPETEKPADADSKAPKTSEPDKPPGEMPPGDKPESEAPDSDSPKPESNTPPSESSASKPSDSKGSPSPGSPKKPGKDQKQTPGREQLEQAKKLMQEALDLLQQQEKQPAIAKQDEAITELTEAAEKLDEMLRQLREEEKEMLLAALEARFQRMLALQTQIHEGTVELGMTPRENWLDQYFGRCRDLAQQQSDLTSECSNAANLLREDGTSVSILMAVEDIETDMNTVAGYLRESKVGGLTQSVETDILESLKQLIEAAQKEMEDMKSEERKQQPHQQSDEQKKPPLVELMAEIKVLRSLQLRVNRRTKQVDELLQTGKKDDQPDLLRQVGELAGRQQRLFESAGELSRQVKQQQQQQQP